MYIKVIPANISFGDEALIYYIKDNQKEYINIGGVVSIPFGKNITYGIISEINIKNDYGENDIKSIIDILCTFPILSKYQIDLIFELSKKYFLPIHKVVNLFLPNFILKRLEKNAFQDILDFNFPTQNKVNYNNQKAIFYHNINNTQIDDFFKYIGGINDTVVIFPDDFFIDSFLDKNPKYKENITIYKNDYSYSKKYKIFLEILGKKKNILFGTRRILQYNLEAFKNIVYIEDSMIRNTYNQFEKYSNLYIIDLLSKQNIFNISIFSSVPTIELFNISKKNNYKYITI